LKHCFCVSEGQFVPGVFVPIGQSPRRVVTLSVHHTGPSADVAAESIRFVVSTVDPNLPLFEAATLEDILADEISPQRTIAILFGVFGVLALVLAAVGLYGTVAFTVLQRQREFGVRRALGAKTSHLAFSVAGVVGKQLGVGLGVGVALAVFVAPQLRDFTFGANPRDPLVFGSVIIALSFAAVLASAIPTRRATRVDPMLVLRDE